MMHAMKLYVNEAKLTGLWARNFATIPEPFEKRAPALAMEYATLQAPTLTDG